MKSRLKRTNCQEILITTIHNQEDVMEIYFNEKMQLVTELVYKSNNRASIYQHTVALYLKQHKNFNGVEKKINDLMQL